MCLCEDKIAQLECKIAKLQRRVCELECRHIVLPQPCFTPVWYSTVNTTGGEMVYVNNTVTGDERKC